jgi:hypothetical protein
MPENFLLFSAISFAENVFARQFCLEIRLSTFKIRFQSESNKKISYGNKTSRKVGKTFPLIKENLFGTKDNALRRQQQPGVKIYQTRRHTSMFHKFYTQNRSSIHHNAPSYLCRQMNPKTHVVPFFHRIHKGNLLRKRYMKAEHKGSFNLRVVRFPSTILFRFTKPNGARSNVFEKHRQQRRENENNERL